MMRSVKTVVLAGAVLAASALTASAQTISIQADALKDWASMKDTMAKIAEAMPEAKFALQGDAGRAQLRGADSCTSRR